MTSLRPTEQLERQKLQEFLDGFFSPPNDYGVYSREVRGKSSPEDDLFVLPRLSKIDDDASFYVITRRSVSARRAQELIAAFAGPSYTLKGDRVPYELDPQDPVDKKVASFIDGDESASVFRVWSTFNNAERKALRLALELMRDTFKLTPTRTWAFARPLPRLINDFYAALAAGGGATSAELLEQIVGRGGIEATNLAHLRIKRLSQLGLSRELLALEDLPHVLRRKPPQSIAEAVLDAVYTTQLAGPLSSGDLDEARASLDDVRLPLPIVHDLSWFGPPAAAVLLTAAVCREDASTIAQMLGTLPDDPATPDYVPEWLLSAAYSLLPKPAEPVKEKVFPAIAPTETIGSWWDFFTRASAVEAAKAREAEQWRQWEGLTSSDIALARYFADLDEDGWSSAWGRIVTLTEALDYETEIPHTAKALIDYAFAYDRYSRSDLLVLMALVEAVLRCAPTKAIYRDLLQGLNGTAQQWNSPQNAEIALDLADLLIRMPCPDEGVRQTLGLTLLEPLYRHGDRLDGHVRAFAQKLSDEIGLGIGWLIPDTAEVTDRRAYSKLTVLLYSLDENVLKRVEGTLKERFPGLRIHLSHDKDGSPSLRQKARNSDVIALAVRCAKHAATGFIREHAKNKETVVCADGSGSASLLRVVVDSLMQGRDGH